MCVIAICEEGLSLDIDKFKACFSSNGHGAGFAWMEDGKLAWEKGFMDSKKAWKFYKTINMFAHIAHFRLSSAGGISPSLTHPFLITPDSPIELEGCGKGSLLFHNGTISGWRDMVFSLALHAGKYPEGEMSDTRVMAMAIATLGDKVMDDGKYVIATPTEFTMYGNWIEHEGIHYTNNSYQSRVYGEWLEPDYSRTYARIGSYGKKPLKNAELPFDDKLPKQLRGSGLVDRTFVDRDEEEILTDKLLNNYYGRC